MSTQLSRFLGAAIIGFALVAGLGAGVGAQAASRTPPDLRVLLSEGEDIELREWRALTRGRTVWYYDESGLFGRERYFADVDVVTFQLPGGQCLEARWERKGQLYCFDFGEGAPHCFRHMRLDGEIWVVGVNGAVQRVGAIDDSPLACGPAQTS